MILLFEFMNDLGLKMAEFKRVLFLLFQFYNPCDLLLYSDQTALVLRSQRDRILSECKSDSRFFQSFKHLTIFGELLEWGCLLEFISRSQGSEGFEKWGYVLVSLYRLAWFESELDIGLSQSLLSEKATETVVIEKIIKCRPLKLRKTKGQQVRKRTHHRVRDHNSVKNGSFEIRTFNWQIGEVGGRGLEGRDTSEIPI